jgi:hypothetical protein
VRPAPEDEVFEALKAAFVQGRLTRDEFELRVSQALAAYAELSAITADIPAAVTAVLPSEPSRESHNKNLIARGTAAPAGAIMVLALALVLAATGDIVIALFAGAVMGGVTAVLLAGFLRFVSFVLDRSASRQQSRRPPGASRQRSRRLASPHQAEQPSRIPGDAQDTVQAAARGRRPRPAPAPG